MVVVVELGDEGSDALDSVGRGHLLRESAAEEPRARRLASGACTNALAAILACYPVAIQLASSLDRNALHELSRTCRVVRASLLQFRNQLCAHTLRCSNDDTSNGAAGNDDAFDDTAGTAPYIGWQSWTVTGSYGVESLRITTSKVGPCVRDMVGKCRRCGRVVCRNCIMKPPPTPLLRNRHRRLCSACIRAPIQMLRPNSCVEASGSSVGDSTGIHHAAGMLPPLARATCSCSDAVYICQPCGHAFSNADVNYQHIWAWRTRYGIGDGNEGVQCARDDRCLAAKDSEVEVDGREADLIAADWVPADESPVSGAESIGGSNDGVTANSLPHIHEAVQSDGAKAGYLRQEFVGVGGVVRTKFKRRVRVGAPVPEHTDERVHGGFLDRERCGRVRSWCGWCDRVILGGDDLL